MCVVVDGKINNRKHGFRKTKISNKSGGVRMKKRIGMIGIVIEDREKVSDTVNDILSKFGGIIIGRMGVPARKLNLSIISLIVEGTSDEIGAMTGQLGNLSGVSVKSMLTSKEVE